PVGCTHGSRIPHPGHSGLYACTCPATAAEHADKKRPGHGRDLARLVLCRIPQRASDTRKQPGACQLCPASPGRRHRHVYTQLVQPPIQRRGYRSAQPAPSRTAIGTADRQTHLATTDAHSLGGNPVNK
ncbi:hypothetical protein IWW54_006638, partial [Coemansia sp. RSA 2705]